ncbi:MAG TPA: GatB/YqeY domain-containing protein [Candidatus Acidoferrales bacterium]|nr:GatB/YqeY domain-containing protein [Candidatus Acidoferrales bacterium]
MAGIRERLNEDLKAAMREKAELKLSTIRMIRAEILNKDKETGKDASEEDILKVLQSMVKKREDAAEQFARGGRAELAARERAEIAIIQSYLPAQVSDEELRRAVEEAVAQTGASSMKEMGKVMALLNQRLAGRAAAARVSQAVKEKLSK